MGFLAELGARARGLKSYDNGEFGGVEGSSALGEKEKNKAAAQGDHRGEWMSTSGPCPLHGGLAQPSSCVAGCVAARVRAAPARPAAAVDELVIPIGSL